MKLVGNRLITVSHTTPTVFMLFEPLPLAFANFHALATHTVGGLGEAKHALTYKLDGYTGEDMLPLLLYEMSKVAAVPVPPYPGLEVKQLSNEPLEPLNSVPKAWLSLALS